jgi:hypothetical protein
MSGLLLVGGFDLLLSNQYILVSVEVQPETLDKKKSWKWKPTPELYYLSPDWFEYCFIYEKFVACGEF